MPLKGSSSPAYMPLTPRELQIIEILSQRPISFNPVLSKATGSINSAILLGQLLFWDRVKDGDEFYKTIEEVEKETTMTRKEQDVALKKLKRLGVVEVAIKGTPARRYFKIDLEQAINLVCTKGTNQFVQKGQTSLYKRDKLYIQKITTEDILDNKLSNNAEPALEKVKFGNEEINYILEEFEKTWGFKPTDRQPRYAARALAMNFKRVIKELGFEYSLDRFQRSLSKYFVWINKQDWGDKVQKVDTLRLKFRIYEAEAKKAQV